MRRSLLVTLLAGVVVGAPAALAAPSPQLYDRRGDADAEFQDVLSGRLSSRLVGRAPRLVGELTLAAPPAAGVPTTYVFVFAAGCVQYGFRYVWGGSAAQSAATFDRTSFCGATDDRVRLAPDESFPATVAVKGGTLAFETPYVAGVRKGLPIRGFAAGACTTGYACGVWVATSDGTGFEVWVGDHAWSTGAYTVGSDLPRR